MRRLVPADALLAAVAFCIALVVLVRPIAAGPELLRSYTIQVVDQHGYARSGAIVTIRDKADYIAAQRYSTDSTGCVRVDLDPTHWYVVEINYTEFGSVEFWCYGYVQESDWASGAYKVFRRQEPWIEQAKILQDQLFAGQPLQTQVRVDHDYTQTNYDFEVRVRLLVDDDRQEPWLGEQVSDLQPIYDGFRPFLLSYTPQDYGALSVRFLVERRFEQNAWVIADDSGWQWTVAVDVPPADTPEPTYAPTQTRESTMTPTVRPTATMTPTTDFGSMLWLPMLWIG